MSPWKKSVAWVACVLAAQLAARADGPESAPAVRTITFVDGRVMVRAADRPRMEFPKEGREVAEGEVVITGDAARAELTAGDGGLWRLGRRAVFAAGAEGGRLLAGTALVRVPGDAGWRVESAKGIARLGRGLWMLQAVDNEGLKIICLDGPSSVEAPAAGAAAKIELRPGELVFLRPGGAAFGPVVTIYLEELLATSRLVNAFPRPLAEARRLRNLGIAQREQLKGVTNALVAGARDERGFEIAVPKGR